MRSVFGLVLLVGFALAAGAVYLVQDYLGQEQLRTQSLENERARVGNLVEVFAINRSAKFGEELKKEDLQKIYLQEAFLPEGAFTDEEVLLPKDAKPRYIQRQMEKFEPLTPVNVTQPGQAPGLRLNPGMRAFTIEVDAISGVSGFIKPDDKVDIFWTGSAGAEGVQITQSILFKLRVIAVDQSANTDAVQASVARTVTVEVTPGQVAILAQAQNSGRLQLSLAGSDSEDVSQTITIDTNTMLGIQEEVVIEQAPVPAQPVCSRSVRRGTEQIVQQYDCVTGLPIQ